MKSGRSVKWADPLSRLRYAPSPTASVVSEGAATSASTAEETVHIQQPDGLAGSSSTFDCLQRSSPTSSEDRLRGQHLLSRRFRCAETEAEYLEWHFSIWGWRGMVKHPASPPAGLERTVRTTRGKRPAELLPEARRLTSTRRRTRWRIRWRTTLPLAPGAEPTPTPTPTPTHPRLPI